MRTVICDAPHRLSLVDRPAPQPGTDEVLIRVRSVGLCGTDYHIFAGHQPFLTYPRVMGHELAGEVEVSPVGSILKVGQIVAVNPYLACGNCIACRNGKPNTCVNIRVLGVHADGGLCELIAVPEVAVLDATGLTVDQAAMIEFLAIGCHAVARADVRTNDRVLVVGAGPIGIAVGLFARFRGGAVTLIDTREARLAYAQSKLGFEATGKVSDNLSDFLHEQTSGEMFDVVFDATGSTLAMTNSLNYVAHGGKLVLVGVAQGDLVFSDPEFHKRETTLLASRNAHNRDFIQVIAAIKAGEIPTDALHTHSIPATELPERLPQLIEEADHVLKAIVHF